MITYNNPRYNGSLSSNGSKTTATASYLIDFGAEYIAVHTNTPAGYVCDVYNLTFTNLGTTAIHIQLTTKTGLETTIHEIDASSTIVFDGLAIRGVTVQESGTQYKWYGFY